MSKKSPTQKEYSDAVWDFLLEHSDLTNNGSLFVKFHTPSRHNFESRIKARVRGYHREDTRLNMTKDEKEEHHLRLKKESFVSKEMRKERWKADQEERRATFSRLKASQERALLLNKYPKPLRPLINKLLETYATARIKVIEYKQVVLCRLRISITTRSRKN